MFWLFDGITYTDVDVPAYNVVWSGCCPVMTDSLFSGVLVCSLLTVAWTMNVVCYRRVCLFMAKDFIVFLPSLSLALQRWYRKSFWIHLEIPLSTRAGHKEHDTDYLFRNLVLIHFGCDSFGHWCKLGRPVDEDLDPTTEVGLNGFFLSWSSL